MSTKDILLPIVLTTLEGLRPHPYHFKTVEDMPAADQQRLIEHLVRKEAILDHNVWQYTDLATWYYSSDGDKDEHGHFLDPESQRYILSMVTYEESRIKGSRSFYRVHLTCPEAADHLRKWQIEQHHDLPENSAKSLFRNKWLYFPTKVAPAFLRRQPPPPAPPPSPEPEPDPAAESVEAWAARRQRRMSGKRRRVSS